MINFFRASGAAEDKIESFIAKFGSDVPPENVIELVCQLYGMSKKESIPLDQQTLILDCFSINNHDNIISMQRNKDVSICFIGKTSIFLLYITIYKVIYM